MRRMDHIIKLNGITIPVINKVEVDSTWKEMADTARIVFPNKFIDSQGKEIDLFKDQIIERGDEVEISLGYKPRVNKVFNGFINKILPNHPMIVECEDVMWEKKQKKVSVDHTGGMKEFFQKIDPGIVLNVEDIEMGKFRAEDVSVVDVLEKIRESFGVDVFVRDGRVTVGIPYTLTKTHDLVFQKNVISDDLEFYRKDNINVSIKAVSLTEEGKAETVTVGDGAAQRTMFFHGISKQELKRTAERKLAKFNFDGYQGGATIFGEPFVQHGELVNIKDNELPEREGRYAVDRVLTTFGPGGHRQKLEIGPEQ